MTKFAADQRVYHHGRPATVVRSKGSDIEIRYDRHRLTTVVPSGFLSAYTETIHCGDCGEDTLQALEPVSQHHSRAPQGSVFGWYDCTICQTGHGVCVDGRLNDATDALAFKARGILLDAAGDLAEINERN